MNVLMGRFNDRIKLAEAMKLRHTPKLNAPVFRYEMWWDTERTVLTRNLKFDPFTDANDDYAVLEWMREGTQENWLLFQKYLQRVLWERGEDCLATGYTIGDYARAALKVIDNE